MLNKSFKIRKIKMYWDNVTASGSLMKNRFCGERGSNTRPSDLQSDALPTELSPHVFSIGDDKI